MSETRKTAEALAVIDIKSTRHMWHDERADSIETLLNDLLMLAEKDGCIAAAWAWEMLTTHAALFSSVPALQARVAELERDRWQAIAYLNAISAYNEAANGGNTVKCLSEHFAEYRREERLLCERLGVSCPTTPSQTGEQL